MRAILQRVTEASVKIDNELYNKIGMGLLVLLGIEDADGPEDIEWLSRKITNMRIFDDGEGIMNLSIKDINGEILLVSQFTLHASTKKGNRPSYIKAAKPGRAVPLYEQMIKVMSSELGETILTGKFGAQMNVALINDGPVTIWIDSKNRE